MVLSSLGMRIGHQPPVSDSLGDYRLPACDRGVAKKRKMKRVCSRNLLNCAGCDGLFPPPMDMYPAKNRAGVCGSGSVLLLRRVECTGTLAVSSARIRSSG